MSAEDRAQELEVKVWEQNNRPRTELVKFEPGQEGYGPEECDECGADMHPVRRGYGFKVCVSCQTALERRR